MPVPLVEVNAVEDFAIPSVVMMFEPPPMVTGALTVKVSANFTVTPSESVTVTLS